MSVLSGLYTLIITPLELLFEVIFTIANRIIGNEGLSIIFLSLAVNFLVLPLYKRADELQAEERDIQAKMASVIKHIKKTFKGDERFFMLQEYYRINHYKPIYALKSSVSLLLQIPFFIAAYNLLSGMQSLNGMSFGFIRDLGQEDTLFMIGSFPVNVLPILMTLINIISGVIYTKGHPLKAKIQVYGLAAVFLVLLYHSPAGLVFYWLLNNIFSLVKNIFYKLKNPKKVLSIVLAIAGTVLLITTAIRTDLDARQKILLATGAVLLGLPLISEVFKKKKEKPMAAAKDTAGFFAGTVLMALITGLLIPSNVINASIEEFIDVTYLYNPALYIVTSMLVSLGCWVLWVGVFYFFANDSLKPLFCKTIWIICGVSVIDYMLFGTNLGTLSSTLQYEKTPTFSLSQYLINFAVVISVAIVCCFIYLKFQKIIKLILTVAILAVFFIGYYQLIGIWGSFDSFKQNYSTPSETLSIPLSKDGNNVIVLMLDRAMGTQVPYILNEKPELKEQFDGFTYYPNTISYGAYTNFGVPAVYGGYEYTPAKMNERSSESLASKQNEALKVMPVLFSENDYNITIFDPSYAGYNWIPDLSIYDDYPEFSCYNSMGQFSIFNSDNYDNSSNEISIRIQELRNRNLFCFSLMKIAPVIMQESLYDNGLYNEACSKTANSEVLSASSLVQSRYGLSKSIGYDANFIDSYSVLYNLPNITEIKDDSDNYFLMMSNDTTHSECLLQEPDYVPAIKVDNTAYDVDMISRYTVNGKTMKMNTEQQVIHYHVNMASFLMLGKWFDYLRENGVYDNTRIIIVADHGRNLGQFDVTCNDSDMEFFMPLMLVKDFNATGFTTSEEFMTNGDTPVLATSGLIDNPINPFTGNPLTSDAKNGPQTVMLSYEWNIRNNNGNTFLPGSWFTFTGGDPHNPDNWVYIGDY